MELEWVGKKSHAFPQECDSLCGCLDYPEVLFAKLDSPNLSTDSFAWPFPRRVKHSFLHNESLLRQSKVKDYGKRCDL